MPLYWQSGFSVTCLGLDERQISDVTDKIWELQRYHSIMNQFKALGFSVSSGENTPEMLFSMRELNILHRSLSQSSSTFFLAIWCIKSNILAVWVAFTNSSRGSLLTYQWLESDKITSLRHRILRFDKSAKNVDYYGSTYNMNQKDASVDA